MPGAVGFILWLLKARGRRKRARRVTLQTEQAAAFARLVDALEKDPRVMYLPPGTEIVRPGEIVAPVTTEDSCILLPADVLALADE